MFILHRLFDDLDYTTQLYLKEIKIWIILTILISPFIHILWLIMPTTLFYHMMLFYIAWAIYCIHDSATS